MSFRQNGNRRYGAIPPAQYAADQGQNLRRQSSFDNGDDASYVDSNTNVRHGDSFSRTGAAYEDHGLDAPHNNYQSPTRGSYESSSPSALSGYQHQYQPSSGSPQPAAIQSPSTYNPQHFARTMSQSQAHSTPYQTNAPLYTSTNGPGNIAPYNPALYQGQAQRQPAQSPQIPFNYAQSYASPSVPQSSNNWSSQSSFDPYNQAQAGPSAPPIPLPPKPSAYILPPQAAPYAYTGAPYPVDRPPNQHGRSPQSARMPVPAEMPYRSVPTPPTPQREATFSDPGLQRHPTSRPLPSAPLAEEQDMQEWDSAEDFDQETLFNDISRDLQQYSSRPSTVHQGYGDLLDGELEERRRYDSEATTLHPVSSVQASIYDEDSDPEAAAGIEAMRIADQQDALRDSGSLFDSYAETPPATAMPEQGNSSDSDYAQASMDIGLYSGGYDGRISYGDSNFDPIQENRDEMDDQSRPLPMPYNNRRTEEHQPPLGLGGIVSYQDSYGTDLQQEPGRHRAYSYNDGDERPSVPSRLSGMSGSSSPSKDGYEDFYYGPGPNTADERPLPALPIAYNSAPILRPAGSYRNSQDTQYARNSGVIQFGPNGYDQLLSPTNQGPALPRSASHTGSSNHPRAMPPVRAKTDAEERQAAKHRLSRQMQTTRAAGSLDGYDSATPNPPDLPTLPAGGRRKKFNPEKLSSNDFKKCLEPWALSSVSDWLREMCGGETDGVDSDLKEKMLSEGLVNLFTHKVPTMNTTDAETLSEHVLQGMFAAGILIRDEEWVKLDMGEISGVLWQLTGAGCYSPKLHDQQMSGRCYSHHCSRTLKKISLQPSEVSHKGEDWATFYKITEEDTKGKSKKEVERQHILHEVIMSEHTFLEDLHVLESVYRDSLLSARPPVVTPNRLPKLVEDVWGKVGAMKKANEDHLLPQLKYKQTIEGPWISGCGNIFREWIRKARQAYTNYAASLPNAIYQVKKEIDRNVLFVQFLKAAREDKLSNRLSWDSFLKAPMTRLQRYPLLLGTVLKTMIEDSEEKATLAKAIEEIKAVAYECNDKVAEMEKAIELKILYAKLVLRPGIGPSDLALRDPQRKLFFRGDLVRAGHNRFTWIDIQALLFDHYLILAKVIPSKDSNDEKRGERYDVSKAPIPMQLLMLEGDNDDPVVKRDVKGIGAVTTSARPANASDLRSRNANGDRPYPLNHTNTNSSMDSGSALVPKTNLVTTLEPDEKRMYPFRIKHLGKSEVYTLYASTAKIREEWCEQIVAAKTRHAASLHEQNAEPFGLRVIADSSFAYDDATAASKRDPGPAVRETPLYRAVREIDDTYGPVRPNPVCRAQVNCGTSFTAYGKSMMAIGTDYGVFISEVASPRGWNRAIVAQNVTQIAVLEEFMIFLVLANKSITAYHLDVVVPVSNFPSPPNDSARRAPQRISGSSVGFFTVCRMKDRTLFIYKKKETTSSVFKVMEPVLQKSAEKKSRFFGKKLVGGGGTEFFREFDDFYIPAESYGLNVFNTTIAVSSSKGFELLTLDAKKVMSVPQEQDQSYKSIASRISSQRPIGMFRIQEKEFMLVYEDCGVYIDGQGSISRSVFLELIGKAKSATMFENYLILFNDDFVEVRDAKSGRLRQIIAGKDIKCLDHGVEGRIEGGHRSVKISMTHPEHASIQLVLELVLNEDSREWKG